METEFFNISFWRSIVSTGFVTLLAVATAMGIYWLQGRAARKSVETRRKRLAQALRSAVSKNLQVAKDLSEESLTTIILSPMDLALLDATASLKYELITDVGLSNDIDAIRFDFATLDNMLRLRQNMEFSAFSATRGSDEVKDEISGKIKTLAGGLLRQAATYEIHSRLTRIAVGRNS